MCARALKRSLLLYYVVSLLSVIFFIFQIRSSWRWLCWLIRGLEFASGTISWLLSVISSYSWPVSNSNEVFFKFKSCDILKCSRMSAGKEEGAW